MTERGLLGPRLGVVGADVPRSWAAWGSRRPLCMEDGPMSTGDGSPGR